MKSPSKGLLVASGTLFLATAYQELYQIISYMEALKYSVGGLYSPAMILYSLLSLATGLGSLVLGLACFQSPRHRRRALRLLVVVRCGGLLLDLILTPLLHGTVSTTLQVVNSLLGIFSALVMLQLYHPVPRPRFWVWVPVLCHLMQLLTLSYIAVVYENVTPLGRLFQVLEPEKILELALWVVFPVALLGEQQDTSSQENTPQGSADA